MLIFFLLYLFIIIFSPYHILYVHLFTKILFFKEKFFNNFFLCIANAIAMPYFPFIVALQRSSHAHHDHSLSLLFFFAIFLSSFCACYAITKFKNLWLSQECQPATHLTMLDGANEWSEFVVALINLQEGIAVDRCLR